MNSRYQFAITGRIKPYVRMTRRGKWKDDQAQEYIASQTAIGLQIRYQMAREGWCMLPEKKPLKVEVTAMMPGRLYTMDVDNIGKAVIDALQGVVIKNDCWIVEARFTKVLGNSYQALVFVETV